MQQLRQSWKLRTPQPQWPQRLLRMLRSLCLRPEQLHSEHCMCLHARLGVINVQL